MTPAPSADPPALSPGHGRLFIVLAAVLWSLSGAFTTVLRHDTFLGLNVPEITVEHIAFWRVFFAGACLLPTLRRRDLSFRPGMIGMVSCFAAMNFLFVSAMARRDAGPANAVDQAASAILLQYTAPFWMYLVSRFWLGEPPVPRGLSSLLVGLVGVGVIIFGGWQQARLTVVAMALGSGVTYAGVIVFLRLLAKESSRWLTVLNHLGSALVMLPIAWTLPAPTAAQFGCLLLFGSLQMALPYWLVARGLRSVSPQEAGTITLLEPLLNPLWAFLIAPGHPVPPATTWVGGGFILGALLWRYAPRRRADSAVSGLHRPGPVPK